MESATGPWCMAMLLDIAVATGARRGAIFALRWSDIRDGFATIARWLTQRAGLEFKCSKSDRPHRVELPPSTPPQLEVHRQRQDEFRQQYDSDYHTDLDLISANPDGKPLKLDSISTKVALLCRRLGLPEGASLHVLRHTPTSTLLELGVGLATVSACLGHSSVRTAAEIYSQAIRGRDRDAAQRWDDAMRRQGGSSENSRSVN